MPILGAGNEKSLKKHGGEKMTFGEKLRKARLEAGYTQEELASKLIISRAAVAKWESDRGMPDVKNLKGACRNPECQR